jgi:glycine cleavage system aminomethyltransferase T
MSVHVSPERRASTLEPVLRQAGGVLVMHDGRAVVANYGSAAGELAACVSAVGLADRSDLAILELAGPGVQLRHMSQRLAGSDLAPGGAVSSGGAWWCAISHERMLVLCEARRADRLHSVLRARVARRSALTLTDRSSELAALAVVGRHSSALLAELGVYGESGNPRDVPPLTAHTTTGSEVLWLLESDDKALALTAAADAPAVWHAIERAGRRFGLCAVGQDALARYGLIRRISSPL